MAKSIEDLEGIGPAFGEKLRAAGVTTPAALLESGASPEGRRRLAEQTGISDALLLRWVNMADLCRVNGVGGQFAELLEGAGVDTIRELATRNAENLAARLAELNATQKLCKQTPGAGVVQGWVDQARQLAPIVRY